MSEKGRLVVVSGFSGAGKGTLMKALMEQYGNDYALSVSATTRNPRPGERDGIDYFFVTTEKFEQMIEADELIEYAQYVNNYYGTPKAYVQQQLDLGKNVILEIEIQGALKIKEQFPDTILMFVTAPDACTLRDRLVGRGTETKDVIHARLAREHGVEVIHQLINDERNGQPEQNASYRVSANIDFINKTREELTGFSKGE